MPSAKKDPIQRIANLLELTACTTGALEKAILESSESGKPITNRQLNKLKRQAKKDLAPAFDELENLIRSLPKSRL